MDPPRLIDALHRALTGIAGAEGVAAGDIAPMATTGIAHDHFRVGGFALGGAPVLLRVPRVSQWSMAAAENLAYQAACFARAEPSGVTPALRAVLPISEDLPMGALVVEEIVGEKPVLPRDLPKVAEALAALHALPVPAAGKRPPLDEHDDAFGATLERIEAQADYLGRADIDPRARRMIDDELTWARAFAREPAHDAIALRLVGTDTHPGNFIVASATITAKLVDLEKALYGSPAIDLAHASLPTSTRWDPDCAADLEAADIRAFHEAYLARLDVSAAAAIEPWLAPMRRLTWLRTMTWFARWLVVSREADGWSAAGLDARLREHLAATVPSFFAPDAIETTRAQWLDPDLASEIFP